MFLYSHKQATTEEFGTFIRGKKQEKDDKKDNM